MMDFRRALACFPTGVVLVTARTPDGAMVGLAVNSFSSVSLDPPLISFCVANGARSRGALEASSHFAVNFVDGGQLDLVKRFASRCDDKFEGLDVESWNSDAPILGHALANLECERYAIHAAGDHVIVLGRVLQIRCDHERRPLVFSQGRYGVFQPFAA